MSESATSTKLRSLLRSKPVNFINRSWILALFFGTLTFFLFQFQPDKYQFNLVDSSSFVPDPDGFRKFYLDLNSDSGTDSYTLANMSEDASCLLVLTPEAIVVDQWNFWGRVSGGLFDQICTDYDHDGKLEVSIITMDKNNLYLNVIEPFGKVPILVKDLLIDTIWTKYDKPVPYLFAGTSADLNHNGSEEIIVSFSSGRARQPRRVYAYDVRIDSLWSSPFSGSILNQVRPIDADRDGKIELAGQCYAPYNYTDESVELQDSLSWFIVYDEKLNYKVLPKPMGTCFSQTSLISLPVKDSLVDFVFVANNRDSSIVFDWYRVMPDYSLQKEAFSFNPDLTHVYSFQYPAYHHGGIFYNRNDKVLLINESGKVTSVRNFPKRVTAVKVFNPSDGIKEFDYCLLVDGRSLKITFYSLDGKKLGSIKDVNYADLVSLSWAPVINGKHQLFMAGKELFLWYEVSRNPWQYLQYLILIGLIGGFFGFIELIRYGSAKEILRRESLRKELLELQLKTMRNQLDPHFTFNALNGLSYLAMSGDTMRVTSFINHFSRLLRTHLNTSDKALVKLSDEIEFLENYMELQRMRFDDLIKLELDIHPEVDLSMMVPKMILQTHVENAVKHGLRPKLHEPRLEVCLVKVIVLPKRDATIIYIEDNGVGRGFGGTSSEEGTGKGIYVLEQICAAVKQLYRIVITQEFEDLKDVSGHACGTRVRIKILQR